MSNESGHSEKIAESKVLSIDEAKQKKGVTGKRGKSFEKDILEKQNQNPLFKDIMSVVFSWKTQKDGSKKLVSRLPSGKILFPDKSEDLKEVEPGNAYICLVYDRMDDGKGGPGREAFAKIICEEYQPKIYILSSRVVQMVWRDKKGKMRHKAPWGNAFGDRIVSAVKEYEEIGFPSAKIIYRKNQR
jgi:hypothetical protein